MMGVNVDTVTDGRGVLAGRLIDLATRRTDCWLYSRGKYSVLVARGWLVLVGGGHRAAHRRRHP